MARVLDNENTADHINHLSENTVENVSILNSLKAAKKVGNRASEVYFNKNAIRTNAK